jgi:hypothetical protein
LALSTQLERQKGERYWLATRVKDVESSLQNWEDAKGVSEDALKKKLQPLKIKKHNLLVKMGIVDKTIEELLGKLLSIQTEQRANMRLPYNVPSFDVCLKWESKKGGTLWATLETAPIEIIRKWVYLRFVTKHDEYKTELCKRCELDPDNFHLLCEGVASDKRLTYEAWKVFFCSKRDPHIVLELVPKSDTEPLLRCYIKYEEHSFAFLSGHRKPLLEMFAGSLENNHPEVAEVFCNVIGGGDHTKTMMIDRRESEIPAGLRSREYYAILDTDKPQFVIEVVKYQKSKLRLKRKTPTGSLLPGYQFEYSELPLSLGELTRSVAKGMRLQDANTISFESSVGIVTDGMYQKIFTEHQNTTTFTILQTDSRANKRQKK